MDMTPKAQATKEKISWTSSKLKTLVHQKTLLRKEKKYNQRNGRNLQILYLIRD